MPTREHSVLAKRGAHFNLCTLLTFLFTSLTPVQPTLEMDGFSADFPVAELLLYPDPVVLAFEPRNASVTGGANITVVGTDLFHGQAPSISVAGVPCAVAFANISAIIVRGYRVRIPADCLS